MSEPKAHNATGSIEVREFGKLAEALRPRLAGLESRLAAAKEFL